MKENITAFFRSFKYAAAGVSACVKNERNMRFHLWAGATALLWSLFYRLTRAEYCMLFLVIGFVLSAETVNTAIEAAADITGKVTPSAKLAKDCGAGAVLISAVTAVCCGVSLFGDVEELKAICEFFVNTPLAFFGAALWTAAGIWFVFGKRNGK
ncbi:MAG: diacylglycerol kinase family protein [Ruminococcus sp.]|nr:diacylglycerol kinase family protein [Ruminococcus sp.]